jgi:hypothetical protein
MHSAPDLLAARAAAPTHACRAAYATIVQVKVPQRFHGRVFALNTMVAWSTLPIGFGIGLLYVLFGVAIAVVGLVALRTRLSRFDDEVPDATPDDLVGLRSLRSPERRPARR